MVPTSSKKETRSLKICHGSRCHRGIGYRFRVATQRKKRLEAAAQCWLGS